MGEGVAGEVQHLVEGEGEVVEFLVVYLYLELVGLVVLEVTE